MDTSISTPVIGELAYDPAHGLLEHNIVLDDEFRHLVPAHTPAERVALEKEILQDSLCLEQLIVWQPTNILLDGYTRLEICMKHGIAFRIRPRELANRDEARAWILAHQTGRRNVSPNGLSYVRGKRYLLEKHGHGGDRRSANAGGQSDPLTGAASGQTDHLNNGFCKDQTDHLKTEERLAREYRISGKTMRRNAKFAAAVDTIAGHCGHEAKELFVGYKTGLTCEDALHVACLGPNDQRRFVADWQQGIKYKPWETEEVESTMRVPTDVDGLCQALLREFGRERMPEVFLKLKEACSKEGSGLTLQEQRA